MAFWNKHQNITPPFVSENLGREKNPSEDSLYSNMMEEEKSKIQKMYVQIGQQYILKHGDNPEDEFGQWIDQIKDSEKKIADLQQKIQTLKGVRLCPSCGSEVPAQAAFCIFCGTAMPKVPVASEEDTVACPNCGAVMKKGAKFCFSCGQPIAAVEVEPPIDPPVQNRFCRNCGAEAEGDAVFCTICGAKI